MYLGSIVQWLFLTALERSSCVQTWHSLLSFSSLFLCSSIHWRSPTRDKGSIGIKESGSALSKYSITEEFQGNRRRHGTARNWPCKLLLLLLLLMLIVLLLAAVWINFSSRPVSKRKEPPCKTPVANGMSLACPLRGARLSITESPWRARQRGNVLEILLVGSE